MATHRRWRQEISPKPYDIASKLHSITSHNSVILIFTALEAPNLKQIWILFPSYYRRHDNVILFLGATHLMGQGLLIIEASQSHLNAPHSVGILWTSDQPDAETTSLQHTTFAKYRHLCPDGIRNCNLSYRAEIRRLRHRGHWDRHVFVKRNNIYGRNFVCTKC